MAEKIKNVGMLDNTGTGTGKDYINKMYDSSLASQKAQLETDYNANVSNLDAEQQKAQKQADANLNRTYVEAAKNARNYAETQSAYGMASGTMAQAKLAQNNQLQSDMTSIRAAQQTVDAEIERERSLLAKEYAAAIAKAKADNDMARAEALYAQAQRDEDALLAKQKEAAQLMAQAGDYTLYKTLYGLSDDQVNALRTEWGKTDAEAKRQEQMEAAALMAATGDYTLYQQLYGLTDEQVAALAAEHAKADQDEVTQQQKEAAALMASVGDYSLYQKLYGLTDEQVALLQGEVAGSGSSGSSGGSGGGKGYDNGGYDSASVKQAQAFLGVDADGKWGPKSQAAMKAAGYSSLEEVVAAMNGQGQNYGELTDEEMVEGIKFASRQPR